MADYFTTPAWLGRITDTYDMLWKMVIRPPRDLYDTEELGPSKFRLGKRVYERRDLQLTSTRGVLECSHFFPAKTPEAKRPCVVYLHGNCSSRLEAFDALPVLLPRDFTVFCLDLSGSGRSEGEYISLGHHEEKDLRVVLQHLRGLGSVTSIGLWGRSMGATTSILRAAEDHDLSACVLDSAFGDLRTVAEELVNRGRIRVPQFLVNMAFEVIRTEVNSRAGFDPLELVPIQFAPKAICPAFFGVASDDSFVLPHHTQDLHNAWAGERILRVFDGGHNGVRPTWFLEEAADFLVEWLRKPNGVKALPEPSKELTHSASACEEESDEEREKSDDRPPTARLAVPWAPPERSIADRDLLLAESATAFGGLTEQEARNRRDLAKELVTMGFGPEIAAQGASKCSSVEEATQWIFLHSKAYSQSVSQTPRTRASEQPPQSSQGTSSGNAGPRPLLVLPGGNLMEQLQYLGFDDETCASAASECRSVEAAVEWLASQRVSVTL